MKPVLVPPSLQPSGLLSISRSIGQLRPLDYSRRRQNHRSTNSLITMVTTVLIVTVVLLFGLQVFTIIRCAKFADASLKTMDMLTMLSNVVNDYVKRTNEHDQLLKSSNLTINNVDPNHKKVVEEILDVLHENNNKVKEALNDVYKQINKIVEHKNASDKLLLSTSDNVNSLMNDKTSLMNAKTTLMNAKTSLMNANLY